MARSRGTAGQASQCIRYLRSEWMLHRWGVWNAALGAADPSMERSSDTEANDMRRSLLAAAVAVLTTACASSPRAPDAPVLIEVDNNHSLLVNVSGKHLPRGALWRWLSNR